jgi:hypothetical protein
MYLSPSAFHRASGRITVDMWVFSSPKGAEAYEKSYGLLGSFKKRMRHNKQHGLCLGDGYDESVVV